MSQPNPMDDVVRGLPEPDEQSEYVERLKAAIRSFFAGHMARIPYLDQEVRRITREQHSIGSRIGNKRVRIDPNAFADELRAHKWNELEDWGDAKTPEGRWERQYMTTGRQPGLSTWQLAGSMDAQDEADRKRAQGGSNE